jgi:ornithine cyclodeaminase/alanine dehydrogenase-like protein (mu-crystallin family)
MRVVKVGVIGTGFSANAQIEALRRPFVQYLKK